MNQVIQILTRKMWIFINRSQMVCRANWSATVNGWLIGKRISLCEWRSDECLDDLEKSVTASQIFEYRARFYEQIKNCKRIYLQ